MQNHRKSNHLNQPLSKNKTHSEKRDIRLTRFKFCSTGIQKYHYVFEIIINGYNERTGEGGTSGDEDEVVVKNLWLLGFCTRILIWTRGVEDYCKLANRAVARN